MIDAMIGVVSLASQPLHKKGRVWYGVVTRAVLFPRNPGEYQYAIFVAALRHDRGM